MPTIQASLRILNGINHSLTALRGWVLLGNNEFRVEREKGWKDVIEPSLAELKKLSAIRPKATNIELLVIIEKRLNEYKKRQKEIEDTAQTVENTPPAKKLIEQADPLAYILDENITKMIDIEVALDVAGERKHLLDMMVDVRETLRAGRESMRAYLLSGNGKFKNQFEKAWAENKSRFKDLEANAGILNKEQLGALKMYRAAQKIIMPLHVKMLAVCDGSDWKVTDAWLDAQISPTAFSIITELDNMIEGRKQLMVADMNEIRRLTSLHLLVNWLIIAGGGIIAAIAATFITLSITRSVNKALAWEAGRLESTSGEASPDSTKQRGDNAKHANEPANKEPVSPWIKIPGKRKSQKYSDDD